MPAFSTYEGLSKYSGPAIWMETEDHALTQSFRSSNAAKEYREKQRALIEEGDFRGAVQMDVEDIRSKFGNKYNEGIKQMMDYVNSITDDNGRLR